ncbi:hypothetical protein J4E93_000775 [Alternaria ventricosa]|uniref:uncharacterized protein n=1 Tax=Alternaria ventricosa TaxID=1187951 RepID=UPI0020C589CD|nr:uncharacterized protein J4E93_000775 [Alternaria ventricosa]KAI4656059.1 hypothetical protein J4E93_000775 [Alternaria ventricosa]
MASRVTPIQKSVMPFEDFLRWKNHGDIEVRYDRFVNDNGYEQRITRLPSSLGSQQKGSSHTEAAKHQSAPARLEGTYEGFSIERTTKAIMNDEPLDSVENHDFVLGPRSNLVRLSRKAAVKRNSTKQRRIETERHDSTMQSTHVRAKTSSNVPAIRIIGSTPPMLRRFSFDETPSELSFSLSKLSNSPDFEDVPLSPVAGPELVKSPQPQLPAQEQQNHRAAREEREENMGNQEVEQQQRHVPTTFDQILGEKKIPTALL